ncbi:MAG: adenylate/guanylate cyclase domain-containing protein [Coleofasciculaceae cyanobacterium]
MKVALLHSIRTRIIASTTLLIVAIVTAVVWSWVKDVSFVYRKQKQQEAQLLAITLANSFANHLVDKNWRGISLDLNRQMEDNPELVYMLVSEVGMSNQIVAASPEEFREQYIPDVVPVKLTEKALELDKNSRVEETFILRDVKFNSDQLKARRTELIMEAASAIHNASGDKVGTLRIGVSLRQVNRALHRVIRKAIIVGVIGLGGGLIGSYILARQISHPVRRLQLSAAKIAAGDLEHRADIHHSDEIGALATAFNNMSKELQASFQKLERTLESFERFVPNRFLTVIALDGIENIQVGVAATRQITILFADIRGYTSMSEQLTPLETFALLNDYLACMGQVIEEAGGFIDKYIGDAIMALFEDEANGCALKAAQAMQQRLELFNRERWQQNQPAINIGIGIHRGEVVMGTIGFTSRIESTVIGDAVNVAARVEGLTRIYDCGILVTEPVVAELEHTEDFDLRLVDGSVKVKGKNESVAIYELKVDGSQPQKL